VAGSRETALVDSIVSMVGIGADTSVGMSSGVGGGEGDGEVGLFCKPKGRKERRRL
jgi:hypothetical protein